MKAQGLGKNFTMNIRKVRQLQERAAKPQVCHLERIRGIYAEVPKTRGDSESVSKVSNVDQMLAEGRKKHELEGKHH